MSYKVFGAIDYQNVPGGLVRIDGSLLSHGDIGFVVSTNDVYFYKMYNNDTTPENAPLVIKPTANGENKRWKLVSFTQLVAASQAAVASAASAAASQAACASSLTSCNDRLNSTISYNASASYWAEKARTERSTIRDTLNQCQSLASASAVSQADALLSKNTSVTKASEAGASALAAAAIVNPGGYARSIGNYAYKNILGIRCAPTLELVAADYLGSDNGAPSAFTFTRASTATAYDQLGNLITYNNNELRHDYDPATGEYKGWLFEKTSTNLLLYSEDFLNAAWVFGGTKTANTTLSPDGMNTTADSITFDSTNNQIYQTSTTAAANGTAATFSVWLKLISGGPQVTLSVNRNGGYDTENYTATLTSQWQRFTITHSATWTGTTNLQIIISRNTADCTFAVWGAQLEVLPYNTSYIVTTTATATRQADVMTLAVSAFPFNNTEGTMYVEAATNTSDSSYAKMPLCLENGSINSIYFYFNDPVANDPVNLAIVSGGVGQTNNIMVASTSPNTFYRLAAGYKTNDVAYSSNGSIGNDTTSAIPSISTLRIGSYTAGGANNYLNGHVKHVIYFPRRLSDVELQLLTGN